MWRSGVLRRDPRRDQAMAFDLDSRPNILRVLLDSRLNSRDDSVQFLTELLAMPRFECWRPADAESLDVGWPFRIEGSARANGGRAVHVDRGANGRSVHALWANGWGDDPVSVARGNSVPVSPELLPAALTDIARTLQVDLIVSPDGAPWAMPGEVQPVSPRKALALIGLHMRASGGHIMWTDGASTLGLGNRWGTWMEAARLLRPIWSTKLTLDPQEGAGVYLQACIERMRQVLRSRDEAMLSALVSTDTSRYDGVEALEAGALASKALLDALARAINSACHLEIRPKYLNWSMSGALVQKLADNQPALHALVTTPPIQGFTKIVSDLRNTIHAEPLSEALLERRPGRTQSVALVPRDVASAIEAELRLLGLLAPWKAGNSTSLLLDPGQVLHDLTRWTASLANAICTTAEWPVVGAAPPLEVSDPQNLRWERNVMRNSWLYGADVWGTEPPLAWSA